MILRLQSLFAGLLAWLVAALLALAPASANPASGGYQLFEPVALEHQQHIQLSSLGNFDYHAKIASECCNATNTAGGVNLADGFSSFNAFKRQYGPAGPGRAWHHLVEQTPNAGKFAAEAIHNPANLIKLPHGPGTIHNRISGFYSSKQPFTGGQTVRNWLSTKSYQEQFDFGVQTVKDFGGNQYLPPHLR